MPPDRMNQEIELKDGRCLGFAEFGAPAGIRVFHFHGSAASRFERSSSEELLLRMGIRFLSVDRPGQGTSDFQPGRRLLDWPQDICHLADHPGIPRFYVEGYSAGGPHALACAYQSPQRVIACAAISSVAPMTRPHAYTGMPLANQMLARSSRHFPWITQLIRRAMRGMIMGDLEKATRTLMASIPESDKALLHSSRNLEVFAGAVREGLRCGSRGVAQDDILINRDWGFDLKGIQPRIHIWQGEADVNVPHSAGKYLQAHLPNCRATFIPGEGHFLIFKHWEEILSALVNEQDGHRN